MQYEKLQELKQEDLIKLFYLNDWVFKDIHNMVAGAIENGSNYQHFTREDFENYFVEECKTGVYINNLVTPEGRIVPFSESKKADFNLLKVRNVFCILYTDDAQPYLNYSEVNDETKVKIVPFALAQMRWDGTIGFPGGGVDSIYKETDIQALTRELKEEICLELTEEDKFEFNTNSFRIIDKEFIEDGVRFDAVETITTSYSLKVSYERLLAIQKESFNAKDFGAENLGSILLPLKNVSTNELGNVTSHKWNSSSRNELFNLIQNKINK